MADLWRAIYMVPRAPNVEKGLSRIQDIPHQGNMHSKHAYRHTQTNYAKLYLRESHIWKVPPLSSEAEKKRYPFTKARVYVSALTAVLSAILAVLLLHGSLIQLLYYLICTSLIASAVFMLNVRVFFVKASRSSEERNVPTERRASQWKALLLLFAILLLSMIVPLLLTRVLSPEIWFIVLVGITSGASIAEISFYFHTR